MTRSLRAGTGILVVALALAGCASAADTAAFSKPADVVWEASADVVGGLGIGERTVAGYTRSGDGVELSTWDLGTGRRLWSAPASIGDNPAGQWLRAPAVTSSGRDLTAFLAPLGTDIEVRVVDAATGDDLPLDGGRLEWATRPRLCDNEKSFCLRGRLPGKDRVIALRVTIDPGAAALEPDAEDLTPTDARMLGAHVFATNGRPPEGEEMLGMVADDGVVTWTRPYRDVFGDHASSDYGWTWDEEHSGTVIGIGGGLPADIRTALDADEDVAIALHDVRRVVGLDAATGRTVWALQGGIDCLAASPQPRDGGVSVVCRIDGGAVDARSAEDGTRHTDWTDVRLSLVGIDVRSGDVAWERALPATPADPWAAEAAPFVSSDAILVTSGDDGAAFVDPETGAERQAVGATFACRADPQPLYTPPNRAGRRAELAIGPVVFACDTGGEQVDSFSVGAARSAGYEAGDGRTVVATTRGLALFRTG